MRRVTTTALFLVVSLGITSLAHAQATRTWVSGVGDDANPCSRTAPCKTFSGAISKTANNGEINVLDPGGFGGVTITKSITIDGTPFTAGVLVSGTNAIVVNAANINVTLRGLDINGVGSGLIGVRILNARSVNVETSNIYGFQKGISIETAAAVAVLVKDTIIQNNSSHAIFSTPTSGTTRLTLDNVNCQTNVGNAVDIVQNTDAFVLRSSLVNNATGFVSESSSNTSAIESTLISGNNIGIQAGSASSSVVFLSRCLITRNLGSGLLVGVAGSQIIGYSNNVIANNVGNNTVTSSVAQQ